jgi:antitoxin component YwqK of YwqJK toxin-antitoxin module
LEQADVLSHALSEAVDHAELMVTMEGEMEFFTSTTDGSRYDGWVKRNHSNGKLGFLFHCTDGRQDGLYTAWHSNGVKMVERTWVKGLRSGPFQTWEGSGVLESRGYNADNSRHGLYEEFYADGKKKSAVEYKKGKIDSFVRWRPDGVVCILTSVRNGSGIVIHYHENGTIDSNESYFEGELDYGQPGQIIEAEFKNTESHLTSNGENSAYNSGKEEFNESADENSSPSDLSPPK